MALITTNLEFQLESDNTVFTATSWVDEVQGIAMDVKAGMITPNPRTGVDGTPTGMSYMEFQSGEGLGNDTEIAASSLPAGASSRTMYMVAKNSIAGNFQACMYGTGATRQAFGFGFSTAEQWIGDYWAAATEPSPVIPVDDNTWRVYSLTYDGTIARLYYNNVEVASGNPGAINTVLSRFYLNEALSGVGRGGYDLAATLVYSGAHTAPQRSEMYNYLNGKYITPGVGGTISERAATSGGASGLTTSPVSVLSRAASSGGASGASAASVAVQGRAAISGGASGVDAAPTRVSGRAGASGGLSGASASPVQIATRGASGGGASGATATPQATGQVTRSATCGGTSGASAAPVSVGSPVAASGGASGTGAMAVHVSVREAASGGLSGAEARPAAVTLRAANAGGVSGLTAAPTLILARSAVSGGTSGSEATPADTSRVVDFRATALWDEPQFTALWDEPRFTALWDEPRFVATWRD